MTRPDLQNALSSKVMPELQGPFPVLSSLPSAAILPYQLRAARGLLNWGRQECAEAANMSPETIKNLEHGTFNAQEANHERLVRSLAAHGVEFLNLRNFCLHTLSGSELNMHVNVTGVVLVTPRETDGTEEKIRPDENP